MKASLTPQEGKNALFCHLIFVISKKVTCRVCLGEVLGGEQGVARFFFPQSHPVTSTGILFLKKKKRMAKCHPNCIVIRNSYF